MPIFIPVNFSLNSAMSKINRDEDGHYLMIKGSILQEDTILNVYVPYNTTSNYVKQRLMELKGEIDELTITIGDFTIFLTEVDR